MKIYRAIIALILFATLLIGAGRITQVPRDPYGDDLYIGLGATASYGYQDIWFNAGNSAAGINVQEAAIDLNVVPIEVTGNGDTFTVNAYGLQRVFLGGYKSKVIDSTYIGTVVLADGGTVSTSGNLTKFILEDKWAAQHGNWKWYDGIRVTVTRLGNDDSSFVYPFLDIWEKE